MPRLRRADVSAPGLARRGRGKGFEYLHEAGDPIRDAEVLERVRGLVLPPAWRDVWISPDPMGHIQATGTDAAGRKQYRYHALWRERRDRQKFDEMLDFARALPRLRRQIEADLARGDLSRERVLGGAAMLLDKGFFRIGSEGYAEENDTYGLATIRKDHVRIKDGVARFDYAAKGSVRRIQEVYEPQAIELVRVLKRRRGGGPELLAWKNGSRWRDVKSADVNEYVKEAAGGDFSAKDFRTWNATVLAAVALAVSGEMAGASKTARKRVHKRAVDEVARRLGNTPAVCRASYIDPRVFDRFDGGLTIGGLIGDLAEEGEGWPAVQRSVEEGVIDLIAGDEGSPAVERVA
ncbi:DNA topoisomerase IB [soil metagenome]